MSNLVILEENRNSLLLAEAAGWLHDYFKCSEELLKFESIGKTSGNYDRFKNFIIKNEADLQKARLSLPVAEKINSAICMLLHNSFYKSDFGKHIFHEKQTNKQEQLSDLRNYLSRCHHTSHFDKQPLTGGKQTYPGTKISTPFGFEKDISGPLTEELWKLPWNDLLDYTPEKRENLREKLEDLFPKALGDTRRPINEVDLWSWGLLVGSLYKAALAGALLAGKIKEKNELKWRLLEVRFKGLDYILNVYRIPDLLARKQLLREGLNRVRRLLEVTYPLGSEIYRDENGSVYVVPDRENLMEETDKNGTSLRTLIEEEFQKGTIENNSKLQIGGEIKPQINLEDNPWQGQSPKDRNKFELPKIEKILSSTPVSQPDPHKIRDLWQTGNLSDICTVCGLRPQGKERKAAERSVCDICEQRRANRSQEWTTISPEKTIWTEEAADINGRLALVAGKFHLDHWLDGYFLNTLFVIDPQIQNIKEGEYPATKNPSFSRLRRIWETTRRFWQEAQGQVLEDCGNESRRLKIYISDEPRDLGPFHVYDLLLGSVELDLVWVKPQGETGYFLSASNLQHIARQLGAEKEKYSSPTEAMLYVEHYLEESFLQESNRQPVLLNPDSQAGRRGKNLLEGIDIIKIAQEEKGYSPVIPILAEPCIFTMILPADRALQAVHKIKEKYELEMGKVRDRLPLNLGIVYAKRRTPVRSILEAGRSMLDKPCLPEIWEVANAGPPGEQRQLVEIIKNRDDKTGEKDKTPTVGNDSRSSLTWQIPVKMGDGSTEDHWYPYFFLHQEEDENRGYACPPPMEEEKQQNNNQEKQCRIIHATDLATGDKICLLPATFDFEFLDTNARRFEICYDQEGRRPRRTRPFYLEDLDRFHHLWQHLQYLSRTQCRQVIQTIEAAREEWNLQDTGDTDGVFQQFVTDTLAGASWPQEKKWNNIPEQIQKELIAAGVKGELADLIELYMEILKQ